MQSRANSFASWFLFSAGVILALNGTSDVLAVFGKTQAIGLHDPILGISFRHILLLAGIVELVVSFLCLFTNKGTLSLALVAWLAANFGVYRVGLWTMGWHHPYAWLFGAMGGLDISPLMADGIVTAILAFLFVGSITMIWIERRKAKATGFLKISCSSCSGHIEFPVHSIGQKIQCPHCAKTITLSNPG